MVGAASSGALQRLGRADVGPRRTGAHGDADAGLHQIGAAAGRQPALGDEARDVVGAGDHQVERLAVGQALADGGRGRPGGHDPMAGRLLEARDQLGHRLLARAGGEQGQVSGVRERADEEREAGGEDDGFHGGSVAAKPGVSASVTTVIGGWRRGAYAGAMIDAFCTKSLPVTRCNARARTRSGISGGSGGIASDAGVPGLCAIPPEDVFFQRSAPLQWRSDHDAPLEWRAPMSPFRASRCTPYVASFKEVPRAPG